MTVFNRSKFNIFNIMAIASLGAFMVMASPQAWAQSNDAEDLVVEADQSLQWQRDTQIYIATGNATAQRGPTLLSANVIEAHYTGNEENHDGIDTTTFTLIKGMENAELTHNDTLAKANNIVYDLIKDTVELSGNKPFINNAGEILEAESTIFYDRSSRIITANGNAKITLSNEQTLHGDIIVATLNADENDIIRVVATGNTEVISQEDVGVRQAFSDKMVYLKNTGRAVLTGNVVLIDGNNTMRGDKAEIDTITGSSTMSASTSGKRVGGVFKPAE